MAEDYVRLPLVPRERGSVALASWRFRVGALIALALLVAAVVWLFLHFSNVGAEDPGLGGALRAPQAVVAAAP
jgi:hypothetical protein